VQDLLLLLILFVISFVILLRTFQRPMRWMTLRKTPATTAVTVTLPPNDAIPPRTMMRRRQSRPIDTATRYGRKPAWVLTETLRLCALLRRRRNGKVMGYGQIAAIFNARFAVEKRMTISKSYVCRATKNNRYEIKQLQKAFRQTKDEKRMPHQLWAIEFTQARNEVGDDTDIGFCLDAGSRACLSSLSLKDKTAITTIEWLCKLIRHFGKPSMIRTDNGSAFTSSWFAWFMRVLDIRHQRTQAHSPWQNGLIERLIGTFKRTLNEIELSAEHGLNYALAAINFHYNHVRPHSALRGLKPIDVWRGTAPNVGTHEPIWFDEAEGLISGWLWRKKKPPP
jgi:putative transposase